MTAPPYRPLTAADVADVSRIRAQAFNTAPGGGLDDPGQYRGLCDGGRLLAILRLRPAVQFFGGAPVPVTKVGSVAVDMTARGRGLGGRLLRAALAEMAANASAVSVLHPTLVGVYRAVGYELAGTRTRYRVPVADLPRAARGAAIATAPPAEAELAACHARLTERTNGLLSRLDGIGSDADHWLVAREGGDLTGYLRYRQAPDGTGTPGEEAGYRFSVDAAELVWNTAEAAHALLAGVAAQAPLATTFSWLGPSADPLLSIFPVGRPVVEVEQRWMSRLTDVVAAMTARGWPGSADLDLSLRISDPVLAANDRALRVIVRDGTATAEPVPDGDVSIDVAALAALWTGWAAPQDLVRLGRLTGADGSVVDALAVAFAGPRPYLIDWF